MKRVLRPILCSVLALGITFATGAASAATSTTCNPTFVTRQGNTFTVLPTGTVDTANLQCAFDSAVEAGPGSIVKLVAGTFFIDQNISVANFDGTFRGAGKLQTVVQNIDVNPFPPHRDLTQYPWSSLFTFYQDENGVPSSISVSDLTFRAIGFGATNYLPGDLELRGFNILELMGKVTGVVDDEVSYLNTSVIRVGFEGQSGPQWWSGSNTLNAVIIVGEQVVEPCGIATCLVYFKPLSGRHVAQDCSFTSHVFGYGPVFPVNSTFLVEDSTFADGVFPLYLADIGGSTADIRRNTIQGARAYGVLVDSALQASLGYGLGPHGALPPPSSLSISQNNVSMQGTGDGIGVTDYAYVLGASTFGNVAITGNKVDLGGTPNSAIFGMGVSGVSVSNNKVTGRGGYGIAAGLWDDPVRNWLLVGNNLQNARTEWPPIVLGPSTSNFVVVGGKNSVNVLDLGTNNTVTGIKPLRDAKLGPLVREGMQNRRDLWHLLR